jgi:hypothetical protein
MLCQMVCIDRRYQRMNCFNIREIQTLLRSKYHPDSLSVIEHHNFLNSTVIGLRYKIGGLESIDPSMLISFNYGLLNLPTDRDQLYYLELEYTCSNQFSYYYYKLLNQFYNLLVQLFYTTNLPFNYFVFDLGKECFACFSEFERSLYLFVN